MSEWIKTWLEIGRKNPWISSAYDPPFTKDSFIECSSYEEMFDKATEFCHSVGTAFYYKDICIIQQVNGGDEWLVIKQNLDFESFSLEVMGKEKFLMYMQAIEKAPLKACKNLEYKKYAS